MTTFLGYCRVSTEQQSLDLQLAALEPVCGDRIWQEKKSGTKQAGRTELAAIVEEAKRLRGAGKEVTICCYSLSRFGRGLVETYSLIEKLRAAGIGFRSVTESLDTATPMGRAFVGILASLAQAEAEVLSERTKAGLRARKAAGVKLGRPKVDHLEEVARAKELIAGGLSIRKAAAQVGLNNNVLLKLLHQPA